MRQIKTVQQRIMELKERVSLGAKICRTLLLLFIISLTINSVLAVQLHKAVAKVNEPAPIIVGTGTMEKISDNMFQIVPDEDLETTQLPPLPEHLK